MSAHLLRGTLCLGVIACGRSSSEPPIAWPAPGESRTLLHEDGVENAYPRLSRDASRILYQSNRSGHWQLYELDLRTGASQALTETPGNETLPDWSPDDRQIAFVSDRDGNEEIYVMAADGGGPRRLTTNPGPDLHPYWSADGRTLLYNASAPGPTGQFDVYRLELATGATTPLTQTPQHETCAQDAPDGSRLVLLRNDPTADDLVELARDGAERAVTADPRVRDGWPTYSPDGNWIYYASMAAGPFSLYRVAVAGGAPEQLTFASAGEEHARPFVSADGRLVVYNRRHGRAIDIVVLRLPS